MKLEITMWMGLELDVKLENPGCHNKTDRSNDHGATA